jgi:NAD(P)-dependent dehydrogenase (short-subunit alcohol dehydrogenase family)
MCCQRLALRGGTRLNADMTSSHSSTSPRIAVVTGANKGIGFHVARKLGARGVHVLVGSRDSGRGETAVAMLRRDGVTADVLVLDVTAPDSIADAVASVESKHGRLDVLVNNAGIISGNAAPTALALDDLRRVYETNVFGVVAATNAFLPLLRLSDAPRIVNVSSGLGSIATMTDPSSAYYGLNAAAYQTSKTALDAFTVMYAKELRDTLFKVNAICPGFRATDIAGPGVNASHGATDPAEGADIVVRMALLGADGSTGAFFDSSGTLRPW